jgi:hypothetical protein
VRMEQLIRPFVSDDVRPVRVPPSSPVKVQRVRLLLGIVGQAKTFSGSASGSVAFYMDSQEGETAP